MKLTSKKIIEHELLYKSLIGKTLTVINHSNKTIIGLKGEILYESYYQFHIRNEEKIVKIPKNTLTFEIDHKGKRLKMVERLSFSTLQSRIKKMR